MILEAWASGTPVAGFFAPGPADIIPGSGAGALAPDQTDGLREACLEALEIDRSLARAAALRFSWRACAEEFGACSSPIRNRKRAASGAACAASLRLRRGPAGGTTHKPASGRFHAKLQLREAGVEAASGHQFGVGPLLDDPPARP